MNFVGNDVSFTDIEAGQTMTCDQMDFAGTVVEPGSQRAFGDNMGELGELSTSGCTNPLAGIIEVTLVGSPTVSIVGPPDGTAWPAQLIDVKGEIVAAGCSFTVEGAVEGIFDTATQVVTPTGNSIIIADVPEGYLCAALGFFRARPSTSTARGPTCPPPAAPRSPSLTRDGSVLTTLRSHRTDTEDYL
ncbi:hypothetical protein ASG90_03960 [Nocardioides sp. Soil797]|nr:hypothetical protein ASG90_03960 [Nocardioides sp. Soil797]